MTLGFVMLCHISLDRAAQVARHWAEQGCPVVIHLDSRVPGPRQAAFREKLKDVPDIRVISRHACEWGTWKIVRATQDAAALMLRDFPDVQHVFLASGSCLPLRPVAELREYLAARSQTDFIESVTTEDVGWTIGGLNLERFTLRFPFSWRTQRRLFDIYVRWQRKVGFRRSIPPSVVPHLGSQWWCLTRKTLSAVLDAPDRPAIDRYFRRVWIPDESYFQTLSRRFSSDLQSRSLTLAKFDFQGKPHVFYDDHLQLLRRSDCFVARKIWPKADKLYSAFLSGADEPGVVAEPNPGRIDRLFAKAVERSIRGRPGLYMQSRFPDIGSERGMTAGAYQVIQGLSDIFEDFEPWLGKMSGARVHGHLFAPDRVHFAGEDTAFNGALSDSAALRDYNPRAFMANLIWNTRGERQCFQFGPKDNQAILPFLASDPNARILLVTGAWAIAQSRSSADFADVRRLAAQYQRTEFAMIDVLRGPGAKARVQISSLADFLENPAERLQSLVQGMTPATVRKLTEIPRMFDLTGLGEFLQTLRNQGMQPLLVGDFHGLSPRTAPDARRGRRTAAK